MQDVFSSLSPITHLLPSTALEGIVYVCIDGAELLPMVSSPRLLEPNPQTGLAFLIY
jgi:hypothetical protein